MSARTDLSQAYFNLATMLDAGMPILRSLGVVIENTKGHLKRVFSQIRETVTTGSSFAEALDKHPRIFPDLDRMLIEAAETSGAVNHSLTMLAEWHEFVHRITRQILTGLILPFLVLNMGAFLSGIPAFALGGFDVSALISHVVHTLMLFYIPTLILIAAILLRKRIYPLRRVLDYLILRIPIFGLAMYHLSICRYAKAFVMMYNAGVPITETTERATRVAGNAVVEGLFAGGIDSVRNGGLVWEGFSKRLPSEYLQLWQIGEETGDLDKTVGKIAEISGDRADLLFREFARWFPILIYGCVALYLIYMILRGYQSIYGNLLRSI